MKIVRGILWFGICWAWLLPSFARGQEIETGLYLRTTYAFGNLSLSTVLIGPKRAIAMDPKNGVDPFDFAAAAKDATQKVGTFTQKGNQMTVAWSDGKTATLPIEFDHGKLSALDGGVITKAGEYKVNEKLDMTFGGSAITFNVSAAMTLKFAADGTYVMSRLGGIQRIPGNTGIAETTITGKYALSRNTLTLTATDGKTSKHTVLPMNTALNPAQAKISDDHMIFDSANLKREK